MTEGTGNTASPTRWQRIRSRLFDMVSVGVVDDPVNQGYDIISTGLLVLNLAVSFAMTFDGAMTRCGTTLRAIEALTVLFFAVDYVLRALTAGCLFPEKSEPKALVAYIFSMAGIIDLLSFLPYYLPVFFPAGAVAFRMFRVARIFRLFRINAYYDSLNVITEVIVGKSQQILSSVFILVVLMMASSLCMYSLEHEAQPDVFTNAFSGIWWSVSTLLTVGYGDIYPVTVMGKVFGICITFLGVLVVAIPTGIISAGFVEQYTRLKRIGDVAQEEDVRFIKLELKNGDPWLNRAIKDLDLPDGLLIAGVQRNKQIVIPRGDLVLQLTDTVILAAEALKDDQPVNIKEIILKENHPWNGREIRDLDISRKTFIVMIKRGDTTLIPRGHLVLQQGDKVFLYSVGSAAIADLLEF
ncbi:MAG: ion transporter [Lachnospiraceae bacterium]|nr:ion transporter [Lachnospiraceae bacterium]